MANLTHWINGKHVEGTSGRFGDVYNPATGEVAAQVPRPQRPLFPNGPRPRR